MPLKSVEGLAFYDQEVMERAFGERYVGIVRVLEPQPAPATRAERLLSLFRIKAEMPAPHIEFLAAASLQEATLGRMKCWIVMNIAARDGYGPTLYAAIIQHARGSGLCAGASPSPAPSKILERPKRIWRKFSMDYTETLTTYNIPGGKHKEVYLNQTYALLPDKSLVDLPGMQRRFERLKSRFSNEEILAIELRRDALKLMEASVTAHASNCHKGE